MLMKGLLLLTVTTCNFAFMPTALGIETGSKVIYGNDDRFDTDLHPDSDKRQLAKSVAGMVSKNRLTFNFETGNSFKFSKRTGRSVFGLCENERFSEQNILADCSGFLVAPDTIVTAGHCIQDQLDCESQRWVFDFKKDTNEILADNVYSCKKLVAQELDETFAKVKDYAVIKLDRKVKGREPLKLRKTGALLPGTDLFVIGHPNGMPQKIAAGARVTQPSNDDLKNPIRTLLQRRYYFSANLDTYQGNSGSPVFNEKTNKVEGILIQGAEDFFYDDVDSCLRSSVLSDRRNDVQEKVFRIRKVKF